MFKSNRHSGIQMANKCKLLLSTGQTWLNQVGRQVGSVIMLALKMWTLRHNWYNRAQSVTMWICLFMHDSSVRDTRWTKNTAPSWSKPCRNTQNARLHTYFEHLPATFTSPHVLWATLMHILCNNNVLFSFQKTLFPSLHSQLINYSDAYYHK